MIQFKASAIVERAAGHQKVGMNPEAHLRGKVD